MDEARANLLVERRNELVEKVGHLVAEYSDAVLFTDDALQALLGNFGEETITEQVGDRTLFPTGWVLCVEMGVITLGDEVAEAFYEAVHQVGQTPAHTAGIARFTVA